MASRTITANPLAAGLAAGAASTDRIEWLELSLVFLPLATPISDAKVLTGRQKPLTEIAFLFAEVQTKEGHSGIGFSYSKRAGGRGQYAHAKEVASNLIGEDPNDIARLWDKLCWAGASVGRLYGRWRANRLERPTFLVGGHAVHLQPERLHPAPRYQPARNTGGDQCPV